MVQQFPHMDSLPFAFLKFYILLALAFWTFLTQVKILQVIANFSASWCGPCRMISPFYCELSEKYPSLMFLTVDVDELTVSSKNFRVQSYTPLPPNYPTI